MKSMFKHTALAALIGLSTPLWQAWPMCPTKKTIPCR